MGTAFAGTIRTPLTSVIMIFEVTRNYTIIVPLMISNLMAFYISQRFQREPIYEALAHQDGLHLPTGEFRRIARQFRVSSALRPSPSPLDAGLSISDAHERTLSADFGSWPVVDRRGLAGMIRVGDLVAALVAGRGDETVQSLLDDGRHDHDEALAHVHADHPLGVALSRMGASNHTVLPVVSRANVRVLLGIVTLPDILRAYGVEQASDVPALESKSGD
jgi:CIC family chloride channel protein